MLDGDLFDKLAHIARRFRKKENKPFGGIQLIMTGDFFQLPPVTKSGQPTFAFEAKSWGECIDATVNLTKVFRQRDTEFIDMLNEMRFGELSRDSISKFIKLKREPKYTDGIEPTELCVAVDMAVCS
jgi:ATP-dependent DNA helicase PIF1